MKNITSSLTMTTQMICKETMTIREVTSLMNLIFKGMTEINIQKLNQTYLGPLMLIGSRERVV